MLHPKSAGEIMVTKLVTLSPDKHVYDGITGLLKHDITGAPVVDREQNFLGVFSEKCCMHLLDVMTQSACEDSPGNGCGIQAKDFMKTKLVTLSPKTDAFAAVEQLLANRISGAPVLDAAGKFIGVFSEKDSMRILVSSAYDQLPTTDVGSLMNRDSSRVIAPETDLSDIAKIFIDTPLRRLAVVDKYGVLVGQISRRDVLKSEQKLSKSVRHRVETLASKMKLNFQHASQQTDPQLDEALQYSDTETSRISYFMDRNAKTITVKTDFLNIAQLFLDTPYRRLPVLDSGKLIGQISRRDLLQAANDLFATPATKNKSLLYLSQLRDREDAPFN
ncbi:MAG: CBS domain-containing protein [Mariniblastus sp.]